MRHSLWILTALAGLALPAAGQSVDSSFTYQGELLEAGLPVDGVADLQFTLWTLPAGGAQIGGVQSVPGAAIVQGRFAVGLNTAGEFGVNPFVGASRWLEISVRDTGGNFVVLTPRQELKAAPFASYALNAARLGSQLPAYYLNAGNLIGTLPDGVLSNNVPRLNTANVFLSPGNQFNGNGSGLTNLSASNITSGTLPDTRLTTNVIMRGATQTFTGINTFTSASNVFAGSGAGLTSLNASNIASGTVADARLSSNVALLAANNAFSGSNTFGGATAFSSPVGVNAAATADFRLRVGGGTGVWRGGFAAGGVVSTAVMGELSGVATIGAHNGLLNAWAPLSINPNGSFVGVGVATPLAPLHVFSTNYATGMFDSSSTAGTWLNLRNSSVGGTYWQLLSTGSGNGGGAGNLLIGTGTSPTLATQTTLALTGAGKVGIGTISPQTMLQVMGGGDASLAGGGNVVSGTTSGLNVVIDDNEIIARNNGAASPLYLNQGSGNVIVPVLQITGGSDVAEPYDVASAGGVAPKPGMVVAIDPEQTGKMRVVNKAYDRTVAGIISGANGIKPGLTLTQTGSVADGDLPVASIGRVWCWCDADAGGVIEAGDMLTTAATPGHAMRVNDHGRSQGAILGKAMSSLKSGRGLVLVLVSLQ
jgi:hypothetical protein